MKFIYDRNKTAVIFGDREYSYKEIIKGIKYYSTLLKESGKVVVTMENRPEMICSIFSIWDKKETAIVLETEYPENLYCIEIEDTELDDRCVTEGGYSDPAYDFDRAYVW